jgi:putative iron-regulated protein
MKKVILKGALLASIFGVILSCSDDDSTPAPTPTPDPDLITDVEPEVVTAGEVVANYANIVAQNYTDSYNKAVLLQTKVNQFVANPSEAGFAEAKAAWLEAREPYGQTEVYRETNSPIDTDSESWSLNTEGQINAWPCDEGYIDYIDPLSTAHAGGTTGGIIAGSETIDADLLIGKNEFGGDKNISTGWHAIEFLLWGQDETSPSENLAGQRSYTDYSTAANFERRGIYLTTVTDLVVADLLALKNTWAEGGAYRTVFNSLDTNTALTQLINGAKFIAGEELSTERMLAPVNSTEGYEATGQEMEHSCFSDNTHVDVYENTQGVLNVIYGRYEGAQGASFYDLVMQADSAQAANLKAAADLAAQKIDAIKNNTKRFDYLLTLENVDNPGPIMEGIQALYALGEEISASATVIGVNLD